MFLPIRKLLLPVFLMTCSYALCQGVGGPKEQAIRFDGVDDHIDFGDIYRDLELPFTISAWANRDQDNFTHAVIFTSRNCIPAYTGFRLSIDVNFISLEYGDGVGERNPAFRRGKMAAVHLPPGKWHHITAVVRDPDDIQLYLNGENVGGEFTGSSTLPMDSSLPEGFASCGYFISNNVEYRFKGSIDDLRLWERALSEDDIRKSLCNELKGNESGLVGYWDFDEKSGRVCYDRSPNKFHGKFVGNPERVVVPQLCADAKKTKAN